MCKRPACAPSGLANVCSNRHPWQYVTSISGSTCVNAAIPLFFELAVEGTYPIAEGLTTTGLTVLQNAPAGLFLVLPMVPGLGTKW